MYDLVIKGGQVFDGTGEAGRTADIAVDKGLNDRTTDELPGRLVRHRSAGTGIRPI